MRVFAVPPLWARLLVAFVALLGLGALNVWYIGHVQAEAEQRDIRRQQQLCGIMTLMDGRYQELVAHPEQISPATRKDTLDFAAAIHEYRAALGCPATQRR